MCSDKRHRQLHMAGFGLNLLHVLNDGWMASLPLLLPFIQKDIKIGFAGIGLLTGVLGLAGVVLSLPSAAISKRFGGYRVLAGAVLLYSCAFALTAFATSSQFLLAAFVTASIGFGLFHPVSFALVAHQSEAGTLGKRMGSFTAVGDIGRIAVSAALTVAVSLFAWRNTALVYAIIPVVILLILLGGTGRSPMWNRTETASGSIRGLHANTRFILATASGFIDSLASSSLFVFLPFLYIMRGSSTALLGSLSGAFFIGNMLGKILAGRITDAFGSKKIFICSEILMCVLLVWLSLADTIPVMAAISVLLGAVTKGTVPVLNTIIVRSVADRRLIDPAFATGSFVNGIASVISPLFLGFLSAKFGILVVFRASACFALAAVIPMSLWKDTAIRHPVPDHEVPQ